MSQIQESEYRICWENCPLPIAEKESLEDWGRRRFEEEVARLRVTLGEQRARMQKALALVQKAVPETATGESGYRVSFKKASFEGPYSSERLGLCTELGTYVFLRNGGEEEIYLMDYSSKDYPDLGVKKGFTIRQHRHPQSFSEDPFADLKAEDWEGIDRSDPRFSKIVGFSIIGVLEYLTDTETDNVAPLLRALSEQVSRS